MKKLGLVVLSVVVVLGGLGGLGFSKRQDILRLRAGLPAFTSKAGTTEELMVEMTDGVRLFSVVYTPENPGKYPVVLLRSPYADLASLMRDGICGRFVRYSYICIYQDTRGQGGSEGEFVPGRNEIPDGRDTLQWIADQDFHDGNIAMVGPSYLAGVQWAAAAGGLPPEVKTLVPAVYTTDNHGVMYQDGMFRHETFTAWASLMREGARGEETASEQYHKAVRYRPHIQADRDVFGEDMPWYREMIESASPGAPFWSDADNVQLRQMPERLEIPILMIGGWYDVFFGPQFEDWQRLATQSESRFMIGPWTHSGSGGAALENPDAEGGLMQWPVMLNWLDHHLKGAPLDYAPGVATYAMHEGVWKERASWPPQGRTKTFYLGGAEAAKDCVGGQLQAAPSATPGQAQFDYDPLNPVPTRGGAGMLAFILPGFDGAPPANQWQDGLCERADVLTFQGPVLAEPLKIAGNISVTLRVASSAQDTAFTAKLIEVLPDGRAMNIRDSITSLKFRNGARSPQTYVPGEPVNVEITFWPIEWTVQKGSHLRLDISSSDFPKFHAHSNKPGPWGEATETEIATQTIFVGEVSRLELDVAD